jgi:hypothetical protein
MQLYLDMDGVLADFDKRATEILGMPPQVFEDRYGTKAFWTILQDTEGFYSSFQPMIDMPFLLEAVEHLSPIVLTGVPSYRTADAVQQKQDWNATWTGLPVITCRSKDKSTFCKPGDIIVDDRTEYKHLWEAKGGIWITHTSAYSSIQELRGIHVLG